MDLMALQMSRGTGLPSIQEFNLKLIERFTPKLKDGGALYLFGKPDCIDFIDYRQIFKSSFKNRMVSTESACTRTHQLYQ